MGHSRSLLGLLLQSKGLILSEAILVELDETLRSDRRLARLVPTVTRARYVAFLARAARLVEPVDVERSPDPEDDHVLGTAAAAGATLVTGDKALLPGGVHGVRVITVRQALAEVRSRE